MSEMRLYNTNGNRLYLTTQERGAFLDAARMAPPEVRTWAAASGGLSRLRVLVVLYLNPYSRQTPG